jgi:hypothetical protein
MIESFQPVEIIGFGLMILVFIIGMLDIKRSIPTHHKKKKRKDTKNKKTQQQKGSTKKKVGVFNTRLNSLRSCGEVNRKK